MEVTLNPPRGYALEISGEDVFESDFEALYGLPKKFSAGGFHLACYEDDYYSVVGIFRSMHSWEYFRASPGADDLHTVVFFTPGFDGGFPSAEEAIEAFLDTPGSVIKGWSLFKSRVRAMASPKKVKEALDKIGSERAAAFYDDFRGV